MKALQENKFNKILVIGSPGAGKSTFARKLSKKLNIPLFHLDLIWHKPDKTTISREEFDRELNKILIDDKWIIDGHYGRTLEKRILACQTVLLLDLPLEICLQGICSRIGQPRPDMPWQESEFDPEFKEYVINFQTEELPKAYSLLEKYKNKNIIVFNSHKELEEFLNLLNKPL